MRSLIGSIFLLSFLVVSLPAHADSPLDPPAKVIATSPDGFIIATSYPVSLVTKIENKEKKALWQIPGWHRWLFIANDGKHAVIGYDGMNLIPQDYNNHMVLISFWREGKKIRDVTLEEVVPKKAMLKKTTSHYHWGSIEGIDRKGRLVIKRADEKVLLYNLETGRQTD